MWSGLTVFFLSLQVIDPAAFRKNIAPPGGVTKAVRDLRTMWRDTRHLQHERPAPPLATFCCCKYVSLEKHEKECDARNKTKLGGKRHFHPDDGACCKYTDKPCFVYRGYSEAEYTDDCHLDERLHDPPVCCESDAARFFVTKTFRKSYRGKVPRVFSKSYVPVSSEFIAGATYGRRQLKPVEVVDHLRSLMRDDQGDWSCNKLTVPEDGICDISYDSPNKCCCPLATLWGGHHCIKVNQSLPEKVEFEGATWRRQRQTYTECISWKKEIKMLDVEYEESYNTTCSRVIWVKKPGPGWFSSKPAGMAGPAALPPGTSESSMLYHYTWVKESYPCTQTKEVCCRKEPHEYDVCDEEVEKNVCNTGEAYYNREVPSGTCRGPETLIATAPYGSKCPESEVPGGYVTKNLDTCECGSPCD